MELHQSEIVDRIKTAMDEKGENIKSLAQRIRFNPDTLAKLLRGERRLVVEQLGSISQGLNVGLTYLLYGDRKKVPVLSPVQADTQFDYRGLMMRAEVDADIETVERPPGVDDNVPLYALRVEGDSMLPVFKAGAFLYAEKNSHPKIETGDYVVWTDPKGIAGVRRVTITADGMIILKGLSHAVQDEVVAANCLPLMDKIIAALF